MTTHGSAAKTAREQKEAHPERYCPATRCLWRTGDGSRCPRHGGEVKAKAAPRLPLAGERVEYRNGFGSPLYVGTATGKPCADNYCHAVHVLPDGREPPDIHHVPAGFFSRGAYQSNKWARVVVPSETTKGTK